MLHIIEHSTDEILTTLKHSDHVFHDALDLVKQGETRFHVSDKDGEDMYACDSQVLSDDSRAREFNEGFRGQLKAFASPASIPMLCSVYRGIVEGYQKAIGANMLDRIMQGGAGPQISVGASFLGRIAAGDYGRRIHMDVFRIMPQKMCMAYMMEVGDEFYISYTLGAKTDRYVRDMTEHMHELGMSHAVCETV